jgi:hypothetical protein
MGERGRAVKAEANSTGYINVTMTLAEARQLVINIPPFERTTQGRLSLELTKALKTIPLADRLRNEAEEVRHWDRCAVQTFERRLREIANELDGMGM